MVSGGEKIPQKVLELKATKLAIKTCTIAKKKGISMHVRIDNQHSSLGVSYKNWGNREGVGGGWCIKIQELLTISEEIGITPCSTRLQLLCSTYQGVESRSRQGIQRFKRFKRMETGPTSVQENKPTIIHKIFETNSSFHVKQRTTRKI